MNVFLPHLDPDATNGTAAPDANVAAAPVAPAPVAPAPVTDNTELILSSLQARQQQADQQIADLTARLSAAHQPAKPAAVALDPNDPYQAALARIEERQDRIEHARTAERDAFIKEQFVSTESSRAGQMVEHFAKGHPMAANNPAMAEACKAHVVNAVRSVLNANPQRMITPIELKNAFDAKAQEYANIIAAHSAAALPPVDARAAQVQASQAAGVPITGGITPPLPGAIPPKLNSNEWDKDVIARTRAVFATMKN